MIDSGVGVILPAAGSGERMGGSIPKQYCKILDKPLFLYALEEFQKVSFVSRIALVIDNPSHVEALLCEMNCPKVLIVQGERTRHRSIQSGLRALMAHESGMKVVVVHDAVRPIVPEELVAQLVRAAIENGAAGSVCPLVSTVLSVRSNGSLRTALDRKSHLASETPQAFQTNVLASAYNKCSEEDLECGTECLQLVLKYAGVSAQLIEGSPNDLWKVTIRRDLYTASECLRERKNSVCVLAIEDTKHAQSLSKSLISHVKTVEYIVLRNMEEVLESTGHHFNNIVFFHANHIHLESSLKRFAALLDLESQGLVVHIVVQTSAKDLQCTNVYDLLSAGREMALNYHKLTKGAVVIQCLDNIVDSESLLRLVTTLLRANPFSMSGQTLFL